MRRIAPLLAIVLLSSAPLFAGGDADRDGITNRKDECPNTQVGSKVDKSGCPIDTDQDGVPNGVDQCSGTPARWAVDQTGCPTDSDRDGVSDGEDSCAATLEGATVDHRGCTSDSDQDGVLDGLDRCQGTPSGYRVESHGCPVDVDHDGVNDSLDRCTDSRPAETVDSEGCRVKAPEPPVGPVTLQGLTFEKNKIEVGPESGSILAELAASMKDWPATRVEIGAYTDKKGSAATNRELSQRRAEFVRSYLVGLGVEESRMVAKGYGEKGDINDRIVQVRTIDQAAASSAASSSSSSSSR